MANVTKEVIRLRREVVRLATESKVALFEGNGGKAQELLSKADSLRREALSLEKQEKKVQGIIDLGLAG